MHRAMRSLQLRKMKAGKDEHIEQLKELSRLTGQLAHEIKNPLSTIKVNLDLVSEDLNELNSGYTAAKISEKTGRIFNRAARKIAVIQKETDRLEQILDGFLRYIDMTELQLKSIDINQLIGEMVDFYSPQAHRCSITIRQQLYSEPLICKIDESMLKQVILNLFINAQQAMTSGGELIIQTDKNEEDAIIRICDTGSGIEPERIPMIFDAYHSSRPHGAGLGLPTAKKIVEAHKGDIKVESVMSKGTVFTIRLPVKK